MFGFDFAEVKKQFKADADRIDRARATENAAQLAALLRIAAAVEYIAEELYRESAGKYGCQQPPHMRS